MKTKTNFLTKLLAVFAVVFLCLGFSTMALTGQDKAIAEEPSSPVTANIKDVGFSGNIFKAANMYWGNDSATSYFNLETNTDDGYDLKITATADNEASWIIHDNKQANKYWWAGCSYKVSFQYMASEGSECTVNFISLINGQMKAQNGTSEVNPTTTLTSAEYVVTVPTDYVHNANNDRNTQRIVIKGFKQGDILYLKNIKVEVLDNHIEGNIIRDIAGSQYTNSTDNHATTQYKTVDNEIVYDIVGTGTSGNCCLGTEFFPWYSGITYELSFYIRTVETAATPSWYLYPRAMVNGSGVSTLDCGINPYQLNGVINDWCKYTFKYTPTVTSSGASNYFGFVIGIGSGENIQIKGLTVTAAGAKSVSSLFTYSGDRTKDTSVTYVYSNETNEQIENYDPIYGGKVNVVKCETDLASGANCLIWDRYITWQKDVTYTIAFKVKTNETHNTVRLAAQYKTAGHDTTELLSAYSVIIEDAANNAQTAREWKTVVKTFTLADMESAAVKQDESNYVRFLLSGLKAGDVVYYTDVKIYANVSTVTLSNGTNTNENVVTGSEYTLRTPNMDDGKAFVGWDLDGTLYKAGDKITVSADTTLTAVSVDFATGSGAYLRLDLENTGVRFTATADKTAIEEALKKYGTVTEFGMHITADKKEGYLDIKTNKWLQDGKAFASAITGFSEDNKEFYGVKFTAKAYLKLKLENNEVITVYANGCAADKSIVDMADIAYRDRKTAQEGEYTNKVENDSYDSTLNGTYSMYSDEELAILREFASATTNS